MATIVALTVGAGKGSQRRIGTSAEATYPTGTPAIAGFPEGRKRPLIQISGDNQVTLFARNIALLIDRPGSPAMITEFLKNPCRLPQRRLRP